MIVPRGNQRNPVRQLAEGALALASAARRATGYGAMNAINDGARVVGKLVKAARGMRGERRSNGKVSIGRTVAPVQIGYSFGPNSQAMPKVANWMGYKGVCYAGTQFFCNVRSAAATTNTGIILKDVLTAGDVNGFYHQTYIRPCLAAPPVTITFQTGSIQGQDPLVTLMSVYRKYRVKKLGFYYVPKIGTSSTAQIALAFTPTFSTLAGVGNTSAVTDTNGTLEQYESSTCFPAWQEGFLDCSRALLSDKLLYCNAGQLASAGFSNGVVDTLFAPEISSPGTLIATIDGATADTTYGRLMMMYEIECYYRGPKVVFDNTSSTTPGPEEPKRREAAKDSSRVPASSRTNISATRYADWGGEEKQDHEEVEERKDEEHEDDPVVLVTAELRDDKQPGVGVNNSNVASPVLGRRGASHK